MWNVICGRILSNLLRTILMIVIVSLYIHFDYSTKSDRGHADGGAVG